MSAASDDRQANWSEGEVIAAPLDGGAQTIYSGTLACFDTTGYVVSAADTAGYVLGGVAEEKAVITAETDGTHNIRLRRKGVVRLAIAAAAVTDVGKPVWVTDDQTVQLTPGNVLAGVIVRCVSTTAVDVDIEPGTKMAAVRKLITVPLVTLTAASATYKVGCFAAARTAKILSINGFAVVAPDYATATLALSKRDVAGTANKNLLVAATFDLEGLTALEPEALTLTATAADLLLAKGDFVSAAVAIGATEVVAGEGIGVTFEIEEYGVPNPA